MNIKGATVRFNGATVKLNGGFDIETASTVSQTSGTVYLNGTWSDNAGYSATGGWVEFMGPDDKNITGSAVSAFYNLNINKDPAVTVGLDQSADVDNDLFITSSILSFLNTVQGAQSSQTLTVSGDITISNNAELTVNTAGVGSLDNYLTIGGDIFNNGTLSMRPVADNNSYRATTLFNGTTDQTISGNSPDLTRFFDVVIDKGNPSRKVRTGIDVGISKVDADNAINFLNGTWEQTAATLTFDDGVATKYDHTIEANGSISLTGDGNLTTGASLFLDGGGLSLATTGQATIGSQSGDNLLYKTAGANNRITISAGTLEIAGRLSRDADDPDIELSWTQSGGTARIATQGHSGADHGTFDISTANSAFTMSAGTIELQNRSSVAANVADFNLSPGSIATSAGLTQFGNGSTPASTTFSFDVPGEQATQGSALYNVTIFSGQTLAPFATDSKIRIQGDFTIDGTFNGRQTLAGASADDSQLIFQGNNSINQRVTGSGTLLPKNFTMNRFGGATRAVILRLDCSLDGVLDFMEASTTADQIIMLGNGIDLIVENTDINAITDHVPIEDNVSQSPLRMVRTASNSGSLGRHMLVSAGVYDFPVGSYTTSYVYTPASLTITQNSGDYAGLVKMRTTRGDGGSGGHSQFTAQATDYLNRYWTITLGGGFDASLDGEWGFYYYDTANEITGSESDIDAVGHWDDPFQGGSGEWTNMTAQGASVYISRDMFTSPEGGNALLSSEWVGDWVAVNLEALKRIFYSRQDGVWTSINTWSFTSHSGASAGVFPSQPDDSVIIGGGNNGSGNHVVNLNTSPTIGQLNLGTAAANTGTLNCGTNIINGELFTISDYSTLGIGSADGITASAAAGNIRTTSRSFSPASGYAIFEYNGAQDQNIGDGLPSTFRSLIINNSGGSGNNTVTVDKNLSIRDDLDISQGRLDIQDYTLNNSTGSGDFNIDSDCTLSIGGNNNMDNAVDNYSSYSIDVSSYIEFNGGSAAPHQEITAAPNGGTGYGNVIVNQNGTKFIDNPVLIRGDLYISNTATLLNNAGVNSLEVYGNVVNSATIDNDGVIIIGQQ
jgi:hypothetical protein